MVNMQDETDPIVIGKIVGIHGIKGWFKIVSFTRPKENILTYNSWLVKHGLAKQNISAPMENEWRQMQLLEGKGQGKSLFAFLKGVNDRDGAASFVNSEIAINKSQLPTPKEGEFYWHDLIDMQVINQQRKVLGVVKEILETGANDVLVVGINKERCLIPYVQDIYIKDVDIEQGIIQVDWQSYY